MLYKFDIFCNLSVFVKPNMQCILWTTEEMDDSGIVYSLTNVNKIKEAQLKNNLSNSLHENNRL